MNFDLDSERSKGNANSLSYRQLQLETVDLEPENFQQATLLSRHFNNEPQQWQAYLNALAVFALEQWLSDRHLTLTYQVDSLIKTQVLSSEAISPLQVGNFKLCLLSNASLEDQEIKIPKNMIDSPDFAAHFYTIIQVFIEEYQVIVVGFLRYDQLIKKNLKNTKENYYKLSLEAFNAEPSHLIFNLKYLSPAAIKLPENRFIENTFEQLTRWLDQTFTKDWQPIEELLGKRRPIIQMCLRSDEATYQSFINAVQKFLKQFSTPPIQEDKNQVNLAESELSSTEVSHALVQVLETTEDEETRWQAAELLWEIAPSHPAIGVRRAIDLGMQLSGISVALMIAILPKPNQRIAILLRIYPLQEQSFLPANLKLIGLDEMGQSLFEVRSRERDDYIQFKFTADPGDQFSLEIVLNNATVRKHFMV